MGSRLVAVLGNEAVVTIFCKLFNKISLFQYHIPPEPIVVYQLVYQWSTSLIIVLDWVGV
jgi:hypothetical protein